MKFLLCEVPPDITHRKCICQPVADLKINITIQIVYMSNLKTPNMSHTHVRHARTYAYTHVTETRTHATQSFPPSHPPSLRSSVPPSLAPSLPLSVSLSHTHTRTHPPPTHTHRTHARTCARAPVAQLHCVITDRQSEKVLTVVDYLVDLQSDRRQRYHMTRVGRAVYSVAWFINERPP